MNFILNLAKLCSVMQILVEIMFSSHNLLINQFLS